MTSVWEYEIQTVCQGQLKDHFLTAPKCGFKIEILPESIKYQKPLSGKTFRILRTLDMYAFDVRLRCHILLSTNMAIYYVLKGHVYVQTLMIRYMN